MNQALEVVLPSDEDEAVSTVHRVFDSLGTVKKTGR